MSLKNKSIYAILGILNLSPGTGYDIKKYSDTVLSGFWNENFGHIYPTLKAMEKDGLIFRTDREADDKKICYSITAKGKQELVEWLAEDTLSTPARSEFMLKLLFSSERSDKEVIEMLEKYQRDRENNLHSFSHILEELENGNTQIKDRRLLFNKMILRRGIQADEATINWCREAICDIQKNTGSDHLSAQGIGQYLQKGNMFISNVDITVLPVVTSTNTLIRDKALEETPEGCTIIANEQTAGRGRRGRSFFAPADTGIYMSMLLRPTNLKVEEATRITTMAAVAVCEAIEAVTGEKAQIKWVNDVFVRGKKVCGILTEGSLRMETGMMEYAVLGVGMNAYRPENGFGELEGIAGEIFQDLMPEGKNKLAAEFLNRFGKYYMNIEKADYVSEYQKRSLAVGKEVNVLSGNDIKKALVLKVDKECRLVVKYEDGTEETLSSGEISIKMV